MPTNKALIVLQENSGQTPFDENIPASIRQQANAVVDDLAETLENMLATLQGAGRYDVIHLLTDNLCSRAKLLDALVLETQNGRKIDLIILGHGTSERLLLGVAPHLRGGNGANGNIRSLLVDAQARGVSSLNLRMVYMCNCYGSTLNDDWLAIGAKASVGSRELDMMPEPMTTFFIHNWVTGQKVKDAAKNAYEATIPFYIPVYPPTVEPTYRTVDVPYPCPTLTNLLRMCSKRVQIPDGLKVTPHTYVDQTKLRVAGNQNLTF
jgi:hypothetical protein